MRRIYLILMAVLWGLSQADAQITTYFYGLNKIQSNYETAALYSVSIYEDNTRVTVELIPTQYRPRMNYWTSENTYILIDNDTKLPIIGFETKENGKTTVDKRPFAGDWGWDYPIYGQKYYYTMVFAGKIPPGVTNFTLIDQGTSTGAHGYNFSNYQLNNPSVGATPWTEQGVKDNADNNNDGICGIYEGVTPGGDKLGCIKHKGEYYLVYLGSKKPKSWWQTGDVKAFLHPSATAGIFKADWYTQDKAINNDAYAFFTGGSMKSVINGKEEIYLKMYPRFTTGNNNINNNNNNGNNSNTENSAAVEEWSGTGFALNSGYVVTNHHVIEKAKSIDIHVTTMNGLTLSYNAIVVNVDKNNDLALLQIADSRFSGFAGIPYRVKTTIADVGEGIFVLGYPLTTTMGNEIKLTTGVISAKTGFQGSLSLYQISAPIQPGNSGGPLFDNNGDVVGVISSKHKGTENVGYAIKTSYLKNLVESSISIPVFPTNNLVAELPLTEKIKNLKNYVFMIKCSNKAKNSAY